MDDYLSVPQVRKNVERRLQDRSPARHRGQDGQRDNDKPVARRGLDDAVNQYRARQLRGQGRPEFAYESPSPAEKFPKRRSIHPAEARGQSPRDRQNEIRSRLPWLQTI